MTAPEPTRLRIELPELSEDTLAALRDEVAALDEVQAAAATPTRLGVGALVMLVEVAGGVLGRAGSAVGLVERVVTLIRGKGVTGARIELPGGATLEVDHASAKDIERLVAAVNAPAAGTPTTAGG